MAPAASRPERSSLPTVAEDGSITHADGSPADPQAAQLAVRFARDIHRLAAAPSFALLEVYTTIRDAYERRVAELLAANNREVERRRLAERTASRLAAAIAPSLTLEKMSGDGLARRFAAALAELGAPAPWHLSDSETGSLADAAGGYPVQIDAGGELPNETVAALALLLVTTVNGCAGVEAPPPRFAGIVASLDELGRKG